MHIGLDFDNTIICYDELFHALALERGLIPAEVPRTKTSVRDYLRAAGREDAWTELQGIGYGTEIGRAACFPGVKEFLVRARALGQRVSIVSHKTRFPYRGEQIDLHACASGWLAVQGITSELGVTAYFELSKGEKLAQIERLGCDVFVDDLPELLLEVAFPPCRRILFAPSEQPIPPAGLEVVHDWSGLQMLLLG